MKIKTKLTLLFSFIFGVILLVFIVGIYHFYSNRCHEDYFERLHLRAAIKVDLIDCEAIDPEIFHVLYANAPKNSEPQVAIYSEDGKQIYLDKQSSLPEAEKQRLMKEICCQGQHKSWYGDKQTYGFLIEGKKGDYIVTATGYDVHGFGQLRALRLTLAIAYLLVMCCIVFVVRLFIKKAFQPLSRMIEKVQDITASHQLSIRLDEGNRKDELSELAITFNQMLAEQETAFDAQKHFVYNISHELRTPLSAIITELELSRSVEHGKQEYKQAIDLALQDAQRLSKLSTNLLDMAKANYRPSEIAMHEIRLDETLLEVCRKMQKSEPDYTVHLFFDTEEVDDDRLISLCGNEYLLSVAFGNLIDNGCKYSPDKTCEVHIAYKGSEVVIRVVDHGIGITAEDRAHIFTPFFRGSNKSFAEGNGIGLSLTHKIIEIHGGSIELESGLGQTVFTVRLRNLLPEESGQLK